MPKKKWYWSEATDVFLRHMYDPTIKGRSRDLAHRLNVPLWA